MIPTGHPLARMLRPVWSWFLVALAATCASALASAQCPVPDQLDGTGCCTLAVENVRNFPNLLQNSLDLCWRDCNLDSVRGSRARWTNQKTVDSNCGDRLVRLDLLDPITGVVRWSGLLTLTYSRTWVETDSAGLLVQVWRYLVNGDLVPKTAAGPAPCPVPPCAAALGRVRFTGYIDYAETCGGGPIEAAWMLTHACDFIDHRAGFPRAGIFHPNRSYSFVGPAAGFVPAAVTPTEGTVGSPLEDVRRRIGMEPMLCEVEEPFGHSLTPMQQLCLCGAVGTTPQWMIGNLTGSGVCGTTIASPGGPFLPGFLSMGIGSWTIPGTFPGVEQLRWSAGGYDYLEACGGALLREVFFGVTTIGGYPARQLLTTGPGLPLPPIFIDQANSLRPTTGAVVMNIPYVSNHILNLNE